jgi:hypothetical protein
MRKCKITVYDYRDRPDTATPDKYEVEAWCVGGDEGIRALFCQGNTIYEVNGDDGHWWLVGASDKHWLNETIEMYQAMADELREK